MVQPKAYGIRPRTCLFVMKIGRSANGGGGGVSLLAAKFR